MRNVKLWADVEGGSVLILERIVEDHERVDVPPGIVIGAAESLRWESEQLAPPPEPVEDFTVRRAVLQAVGHASVCWDRYGVFDEREAITVAEDLIATLGLDGDAIVHDSEPNEIKGLRYVVEGDEFVDTPAEPQVQPDWFIEWKLSQYRADVCDLADRIAGLKATVTDSITRFHERIANMERKMVEWPKRFKLTAKAKAEIDKYEEIDTLRKRLEELGEDD